MKLDPLQLKGLKPVELPKLITNIFLWALGKQHHIVTISIISWKVYLAKLKFPEIFRRSHDQLFQLHLKKWIWSPLWGEVDKLWCLW